MGPVSRRLDLAAARVADVPVPGSDTFANNNNHALSVNADVIAFAVLTYSTKSVNGVPGKKIPGTYPLPAPGV